MERIPVSGPWITAKEIAYVNDAVANAWYANANCYHERFEEAFAAYLGVRHAIALPSCTSAIHLALLALGIGPGHEVIVPECTWIASAAPVSYVGATTVFADIDPKSWCMSADSCKACITPRTKAIIPVDLYGNMPDMLALSEIARQHNIAIVEDAAEAIGSEFQGRKAGSFGAAGVFSFHGSKTLTTGEGGMLVTDSDDIRQRALLLRDHGRPPGDRFFFNSEVAWKYKMSSMQAALGLAQLERVEELIARKREIFEWYRVELADCRDLVLNHEAPGTKNTYWMVTVVWPKSRGLSKAEVMDALAHQNIDSRPFFHPLSSIPAYEKSLEAAAARQRNTVSYEISPRSINLPSALNLTREKVSYVCAALKEILAH
ncbi:MAG TPA: DegT/DnrJ/EryC1/StrS family aminotransferase [Verrucomicrobiae bacterium]